MAEPPVAGFGFLPRPGHGPGIEHLASRIGLHFGAGCSTPCLREPILERALGASTHLVLLLLDGVGIRQMADHVANGALADTRFAELRSVFPSSTGPAITALATGLAPHRHANPGWFAWHPDLRRVVRTLPCDLRGDPPGIFAPDSLWNWRSLTESMRVPAVVLQPAAIADSAFSRFAYRGARRIAYQGLDDLAENIETAIARHRDGAFVYAYLPHFDTQAHAHGCRSEQAAAVLGRFDRLYGELADRLASRQVLLLASADHGFVDIAASGQIALEDWPSLQAGLQHPLTGEPRVAFAAPFGAPQEWVSRCREAIGFAFEPALTEDLIRDGWFGEGPAAAGFVERAGTVTLIARDGFSLGDLVVGERAPSFIGMHGGISADEMRVPLAGALAGASLG